MEQLNHFKDWLIINTSAKNTAQSFYYIMRHLIKFSDDNISNELVQKYFLNLIETGKSASTFNQTIKAVRAWNEFSKSNYDLPKFKRTDERLKEDFITEEQFIQILNELPRIFSDAFHAEIILKVMFYSGLRKSEMINLKRKDIDLEECQITVRNTKSNRDNKILFPVSLRASIIAYFNNAPEKENAFNLSPRKIWYIFEKLNEVSTLKIKIHPHTFRHSACTHYCNTSNDLKKIQAQMRHTDIKTTMQYYHGEAEEQKKWYDKNFK